MPNITTTVYANDVMYSKVYIPNKKRILAVMKNAVKNELDLIISENGIVITPKKCKINDVEESKNNTKTKINPSAKKQEKEQ